MKERIDAILIGGSAGSGKPIEEIIKSLPADFSIPLIIVRHMEERSRRKEYYDYLSQKTGLRICEIEDKEPVEKATVYFSPPGYHLYIEEDLTFALDISEKSNYSRPSIDVTFQSGARVFKSSVVSLILSGANSDGAEGTAAVKEAGGRTAAQDPAGAEFPVMPEAAINTGKIDRILSIGEIRHLIIELNAESRGDH